MAERPTTTRRRRPPDVMYKIINTAFKFLLRTPFHDLMSERLMILTFSSYLIK